MVRKTSSPTAKTAATVKKSAPKTPAATASASAKQASARARTAPADEVATSRSSVAKKAAPAAAPAKKAAAAPARPSAKGADAPARARGARAGARPTPARSGYANDERFLAHQREALQAERATYLEQASSLRAEAQSLVEEMEPGDIQFDEESGEGGTVTVDRERDLALSAQALGAVEEIDDALAKIASGRYGVCEGCGELIPKARLEALPYARLCIACKAGGLSRR